MKTTDNIEKILTPQCEFKASAGLKDRILEAAAVIAIVLVFRPCTTPMYAASDFFHSAIEYFTGHPSFVATLEVRTKPKESFSYKHKPSLHQTYHGRRSSDWKMVA